MSGIYIPGMEMPKDGEKLYMIAFSDGKACASYKPFEWHEVGSVPPHGRLVDADRLGMTDFEIVMCNGDYKELAKMVLEKIENAPTVIPASEEA